MPRTFADPRRRRPEPDRLRTGAQLGVIRTQELLAARQIDGAEAVFTRAIDFGFTARREPWRNGATPILGDVVWVIRRYRPDVIFLWLSAAPRAMPRPAPDFRHPRQGGVRRRCRPHEIPEQLKCTFRSGKRSVCSGCPVWGALTGAAGQGGGPVDVEGGRQRSGSAYRQSGRWPEITNGPRSIPAPSPHPGLLLRRTGRAEPQHAPQPRAPGHAASRRGPRR